MRVPRNHIGDIGVITALSAHDFLECCDKRAFHRLAVDVLIFFEEMLCSLNLKPSYDFLVLDSEDCMNFMLRVLDYLFLREEAGADKLECA